MLDRGGFFIDVYTIADASHLQDTNQRFDVELHHLLDRRTLAERLLADETAILCHDTHLVWTKRVCKQELSICGHAKLNLEIDEAAADGTPSVPHGKTDKPSFCFHAKKFGVIANRVDN